MKAEGLAGGFESARQALGRWQAITVRHWQRFADGAVDFEGRRRDRVHDFLGAPLSDAEASDWFRRYASHYEAAWALFPDVSSALAALAPGYRQGILSNAGDCSVSGWTAGATSAAPISPPACEGSSDWRSCPRCWRRIPVLEPRPPSGNVLPAPPNRAERPGRKRNIKQTPDQGVVFWWGMV